MLGYFHTKMFLLGAIILGNYFLYHSGIYNNIFNFFKKRDLTKFQISKIITDSVNFTNKYTITNYKFILALFLPFVLVLSYYLISSLIIFGDINVNGHGLLFTKESKSNFVISPMQVFFAQLLDTNRGLIPFAPVFLLIPAGSVIWFKKHLKSFIIILMAGFVFYIINTVSVGISNVIWYAGWSPPARYMLNVIPFFVPALGYYLTTLKKSWISRMNFAVLSSISLAILLIYPFSPKAGFYSVAFGRNVFYENILEIFNLERLKFFFLNFNEPGFKDYTFGLTILVITVLEMFRIYKLINKKSLTKNQF